MKAKGSDTLSQLPGRVVKGWWTADALSPRSLPSPLSVEAGARVDRTLAAQLSAGATVPAEVHDVSHTRSGHQTAPQHPATMPEPQPLSVALNFFLIHAYDKYKNDLQGSLCFPKARVSTLLQARRAADVSGPAGRLPGWARLGPV